MSKSNSSSDDGSLNIAFFSILIVISLFLFFNFIEEGEGKEGELKEREMVISSIDAMKEEDHGVYTNNTLLAVSAPSYYKPQKVMASQKPERVERRWVEITGYSSTVDQTNSQPFITASGTHVREHIVAANFLSFGTEIRIPELFGDTIFTVEDRMNQRYSPPYDNVWHDGYVDIWFHTRQEAINLGRRITHIEILR